MAYGMNSEVRVVAREMCRHSHLTHLAERQDKANAVRSDKTHTRGTTPARPRFTQIKNDN